ncbi:hypothetical protein NOF04DRAFT_5335 [Fusarium oxysporum II5]|uniref:Uncharacterized protein n=2 Tax=Fusarium oxysporum species complex TaxID=171631 RepID=X0JTF7_FUSO5|nr:uncharacterized protein FOIG_08759 [Fusarium odoratissimum NRRL 54006]EXL99741.1 hypothetical protein FOIG_08759 [Fusarium odoratissimum NRRL 54006]KAK2124993.1 hypothetical protein NOF04DRAFT_5335 [Fusarium oxysporum II5]TXC03128.1 hypothetical protein FocTR4_00015388 [Fusarium oxysporum f. sp. cubense]
MKSVSAKDPFFRLSSNVREKIITSLDYYVWYNNLCKASVVMNHGRHTNKLTVCSDSIIGKFNFWNDRWNFRGAHVRCLLSDGHLSGINAVDYYNQTLMDPLFSTKPEIVYEMDALYGRLVDYLSLGPEIVRAFIERHADRYLTHRVVKAYGKHGERFPTTYPLNAREHYHVQAEVEAVMREEQLRKWEEEQWRKVPQLSKVDVTDDFWLRAYITTENLVDVTDRTDENELNEAGEKKEEEEWVFV